MKPADRIVLALRRKGWSRTRLGQALGISQAAASFLTNGVYAGARHYGQIAYLLDVPLEWIATGHDEPPWVASLLESDREEAEAKAKKKPRPRSDPIATRDAQRIAYLERQNADLVRKLREMEKTNAWQASQLRTLDRRARPAGKLRSTG